MNPITNIKNQNALNERELRLGTAGNVDKSWHRDYKDSAWIYVGGLEYGLTEGDIICVFSQLVSLLVCFQNDTNCEKWIEKNYGEILLQL